LLQFYLTRAEYDFTNVSFENDKLFLFPVIYSNNRPQIPYEAFYKKDDVIMRNALFLTLLTKSNSWSYEKEWRIIQASNCQIKQMPDISCIYLGAACSESDKQQIIDIATKENITIKQMTLDHHEYKLFAKTII